MANIVNAGYVFKDNGDVVSGATVTVLQADTSTSVATGTTNSSGYYSVTTTTENANGYDVKVESGASVRYRRGKDRVQMMELDIRNPTGATQGGLLVANTTNAVSNKVATFAGRNSTGATNDEIYLTFEIHNAAEEVTEYARMTVVATDATNGSEDGEIQFDVMKAGTRTKVWSVSSSSSGATSFDIETSTVTMAVDDFTIKSEDDGSAAILYMFADQGDDNADKWRLQVADGGVMTYASLISSSYVTHMTITPHATVASSTVAFAGGVTIAADLTITGDDLTMGTNTSGHILVADGTNYNPVAAGGDITIAANGTVTIANDAITSAKIADDAITSALIADDAITSALIADDAITTALIADDAITSALIADGAITTALIGADAVTGAKIADDAIDSEHYTDGSIDNAHLADNAVGLDEMAGIARGKIIYGDASGNPAVLTAGSANYVLTSDGTDISWASSTGTITALNNATANELVTVGSTTTELDAESNLTFNGSTLTVAGVVDITDATDASDATGDTGALRTEGGASIAKKLYVGTDLDVDGTAELDNITIGGAQGSDGQVLTSTGSAVAWEDAGGGDTLAATTTPSDEAVSGITASFTAGETLVRGEVVYFKQADSKMWKAVASAEATSRCVAMAAADISADASGLFLMQGFVTDNGSFPDYSASSGVGKPVYTPEAETSSENVPEKTPPDSDGDFVQVIGFVVAANTLYFNPSQDIIEHA